MERCAQSSFAELERHRGGAGNSLKHAAIGCTGSIPFAASGLVGAMRAATSRVQAKDVRVPCARLDVLMRAAAISRVDLFSLDTEGSELLVLRTFDWSVPIGALVVELDAVHPAKDEQVRALLCSHGMQRVGRLGFGRRNELWLGALLARKAAAAQREWPPQPGSWGCAASRAGHCCTRHRVQRAREECIQRHRKYGITF